MKQVVAAVSNAIKAIDDVDRRIIKVTKALSKVGQDAVKDFLAVAEAHKQELKDGKSNTSYFNRATADKIELWMRDFLKKHAKAICSTYPDVESFVDGNPDTMTGMDVFTLPEILA